MKHNKRLTFVLALAMLFVLTACRDTGATTSQPAFEEGTPSEQTGGVSPVRFAVLSGPTGIGAAKLLSDSDRGETRNQYDYLVAADNNEVAAGLTSGEIDVAAISSNMALNLYNKTDGGVRIIALGTRGVLHILEGGGGSDIHSIAGLAGRRVYSAGQGANPEYILRYLLEENGLDPDRDVELMFADASEISAKLLSGEAEVAMLPVPAATAVLIKGEGSVRAAVDVTQAWDELNNGSQLLMTAVVARTDFLKAQPQAVVDFLEEYGASVSYVREHAQEAAGLVAELGITANAAIAAQAIPQCNLDFIAGADMAPAISGYFGVLYQLDPASVGGALPDDAIYHVP